jgi:hypothetical protein
MYVLAVEDAMCGSRRMCWISYTITHHPALVTFLLQQDDFLILRYGVLHVRISCIIFMYNQYKGSNFSVYSSFELWTSLSFSVVCCGLTRHCSQEIGVHNPYNLHAWTNENPHDTPHSSFQHRFSVNVWTGILDDYVI